MNKQLEIYTEESIRQYKDDLTKAFKSDAIDISEFNKGMRQIAHLQKKIVTDKNGKTTTVYTRVGTDGNEHHFQEGHKVVFDDKGKKKVGVIKKLKHHEVFDKFGTAHIEDERGNKYSKSLRGIEHHDETKTPQEQMKEVESSTKSKVGVSSTEDSTQDGFSRVKQNHEMSTQEATEMLNDELSKTHMHFKDSVDRFKNKINSGDRVLIQHDKSINGYLHNTVYAVGVDEQGNHIGIDPVTREKVKFNPNTAIVQKTGKLDGVMSEPPKVKVSKVKQKSK